MENYIWQSQQRAKRRRSAGGDQHGTLQAALAKAARTAVRTKLRSGSATTTTETKDPQMDILHGECQESFSRFRRRGFLPRGAKTAVAASALRERFYNDSRQELVRDGLQEHFNLAQINNKVELDALYAASGATNSAQMVYLGGRAEIMITNHSSGVLRFFLYVCGRKQDGDIGLSNQVFATGIGDIPGAVSDDAALNFGMRPSDSPLFREHVRVIKVIPFCLSAGQTHIHRHHYDVQQLYAPIVESGALTAIEQTRDWYVDFFVIVHGVATTTATGGDTTTLGDGQFNVVQFKKHRYKFIDLAAGPAVSFQVELPATGATTRMYNPDTGAVGDINVGD